MSTIHIATPDGQESQHDEADALRLWENGALPEGTEYWTDGMSEWRPIEELFDGSSSAPTRAASPPPRTQVDYPRVQVGPPRSLGGVTTVLTILLWVFAALQVTQALAAYTQIQLLQQEEVDEEELQANAERVNMLAVAAFFSVLSTATLFSIWTYRANANGHALGARGMKFTPGWAVGYYFIPILNLFRPFQVMSEIWRVSEGPEDWQHRPVASLLGWWWFFWLLPGFVGGFAGWMESRAQTIDTLTTAIWLMIVAAFLRVITCALAVGVVRKIADAQQLLIVNERDDFGYPTE